MTKYKGGKDSNNWNKKRPKNPWKSVSLYLNKRCNQDIVELNSLIQMKFNWSSTRWDQFHGDWLDNSCIYLCTSCWQWEAVPKRASIKKFQRKSCKISLIWPRMRLKKSFRWTWKSLRFFQNMREKIKYTRGTQFPWTRFEKSLTWLPHNSSKVI